jgi:hypothetical protein
MTEAKPETAHLWDVIVVNIKTGEHRVLVPAKTYDNANAAMTMAIMRRGVETEFYKLLSHGSVSNNAP